MTGKYLTENVLYIIDKESIDKLNGLLNETPTQVKKSVCNKSYEERKEFLDKIKSNKETL